MFFFDPHLCGTMSDRSVGTQSALPIDTLTGWLDNEIAEGNAKGDTPRKEQRKP